jgi:hypothetical protein
MNAGSLSVKSAANARSVLASVIEDYSAAATFGNWVTLDFTSLARK